MIVFTIKRLILISTAFLVIVATPAFSNANEPHPETTFSREECDARRAISGDANKKYLNKKAYLECIWLGSYKTIYLETNKMSERAKAAIEKLESANGTDSFLQAVQDARTYAGSLGFHAEYGLKSIDYVDDEETKEWLKSSFDNWIKMSSVQLLIIEARQQQRFDAASPQDREQFENYSVRLGVTERFCLSKMQSDINGRNSSSYRLFTHTDQDSLVRRCSEAGVNLLELLTRTSHTDSPIVEGSEESNEQAGNEGLQRGAEMEARATDGDSYAQYMLASFFEKGLHGKHRDIPQAIAWYQKSADQNYIPALNYLGYMYYSGVLVVRDFDKAHFYYTRAGELGSEEGKKNSEIVLNNKALDMRWGFASNIADHVVSISRNPGAPNLVMFFNPACGECVAELKTAINEISSYVESGKLTLYVINPRWGTHESQALFECIAKNAGGKTYLYELERYLGLFDEGSIIEPEHYLFDIELDESALNSATRRIKEINENIIKDEQGCQDQYNASNPVVTELTTRLNVRRVPTYYVGEYKFNEIDKALDKLRPEFDKVEIKL